MNGDIKIGKLLCEEDIITKRQLNQALQSQIKGDKRSLGEILVDMNFCSLNDITEVVLKHGNGHEEKQEEITEKIEPKKETPFSNVEANDNCPKPKVGTRFVPNNLGSHIKNAAVGDDNNDTVFLYLSNLSTRRVVAKVPAAKKILFAEIEK